MVLYPLLQPLLWDILSPDFGKVNIFFFSHISCFSNFHSHLMFFNIFYNKLLFVYNCYATTKHLLRTIEWWSLKKQPVLYAFLHLCMHWNFPSFPCLACLFEYYITKEWLVGIFPILPTYSGKQAISYFNFKLFKIVSAVYIPYNKLFFLSVNPGHLSQSRLKASRSTGCQIRLQKVS